MTQLQHWAIDPFDIVWKNFFDHDAQFNTIESKINYPVDIYETNKGLRFELAVVGLDKLDIDIQVEGDTLRVKYEKSDIAELYQIKYLQRGIARRSFDLAWKVASKFNLANLEATMDRGLLIINIPYADEQAPKKIKIK
jgi:HSP20 family molecular chaperone IbpA